MVKKLQQKIKIIKTKFFSVQCPLMNILPYKVKRVYFNKNLKIINFMLFKYSSTTLYSDPIVLFFFKNSINFQ